MKNTRKLLCLLLAAALMILTVVPALADVDVDTTAQTIYLAKKDGSVTSSEWIYIYGIEKNTKIVDVKSSNKAVAAIRCIERSQSDYEYYDPDEERSDYSACIQVIFIKAGKATVSFKIDDKTYKKNFTVVGYVNPVKNFQLTGFNTKNLKAKFVKGYEFDETMTRNAKAGYLKVTAASGWKVKELYWCDRNDYSNSRRYSFGTNGVNTAQMPTPAMNKTGSYYVRANLVNSKNGGTQTVYYYLNTAASNRR